MNFLTIKIAFIFAWLYASLIGVMHSEKGEVAAPPVKKDDKTVPPVKPEDGEMLTLETLQATIKTCIEENRPEEIDALKAEFMKADRKALFGEETANGELDTVGKSVVDTNAFHKNFIRGVGTKGDGKVLGTQLVNFGGPFKSLSPEMETFAKIIKCRFDQNALQAAGVDMIKYNESIHEQYKQAGLNEGTASDGGVLVPVEYMATVVEFATAQSPLLQQLWRLPMSSNQLRIPKLVQAAGSYFGGLTLYWADEAEHKTRTKPQFDQLRFDAHKLIGLVYLTDELIDDSMINIVNYVTGLFTRAFQYEMERVVLAGSGAGQPLGVINDPLINTVPRNTTGTIVFDDIVNMDTSLDENFQDLTWVTRKVALGTLRKLRDNNRQPIFHADYGRFMGERIQPDSMLGYPIIKTRNVPVLGVSGDLVIGDWKYYILAMRQELRIDTSIHARFEYDETGIRFVARMDGKPAVSVAFSILGTVES